MYTEMSTEIINELIYKEQVFSSNQDLRKNYDILKKKYRLRAKQLKDRGQIEVEIIPSLKELKNQSKTRSFHFSRRIQREDFLITAVPISGMLCVKWNNDRMIREWLQPIVNNLFLNERFNVVITDLNGGILLGEAHQKKDPISVTSEFDDYFPPWKIQISRVSSNNERGIHLFKSYYFWSILTLLMILIFGTSLLIRTISREREIIAIKSDFIASVSHELKTPLTSIKALTERLIAGKVKSPEKMHEYFTIIEQDANKLTQLVKNTLDFSKIEEGKKEYLFESTDITSWLNRTIDEFNNDHIPERIEIRKNFDPEIPSISIDRDAISQCLNNLLDNAIKFSPDSRFVEVYLKKDSDFVIIEVKDWGIGIPKENLHRIFDKFFQGPPSTQQSVKGTGLGLALVKHAIEAHNGRIEVQSSPGQGSTFTIFVPIVNPKL
jgi:signal transduction histidine kinase